MSADLSLKDQLDLVQKVWLEYGARQRHHGTLTITTASLFATSLIGGGIAVKNFPNLLGFFHSEFDPASTVILIGIGGAIILLAFTSFYEACQARKWGRLSNMVYNELTVSCALSTIGTLSNFNNKVWPSRSAIKEPPVDSTLAALSVSPATIVDNT